MLPKRFLTGLCATLSVAFCAAALADRNAIGDDGREIILKNNGSWEYKSTDRLATSEDGTRVRLKDNGSWEFIGNAPMQAEQEVRTENLGIELDKVVTEFVKEKASSKNTRYASQTVFYLNVDVSSYGQAVAPQKEQFDLIKVTDSKGSHYPVIAIDAGNKSWEAGTEQQLAIRVEGSPSGNIMWGSRKIMLNIDKQFFGTQSDLSFTQRNNEIKKKKVVKLPEV